MNMHVQHLISRKILQQKITCNYQQTLTKKQTYINAHAMHDNMLTYMNGSHYTSHKKPQDKQHNPENSVETSHCSSAVTSPILQSSTRNNTKIPFTFKHTHTTHMLRATKTLHYTTSFVRVYKHDCKQYWTLRVCLNYDS